MTCHKHQASVIIAWDIYDRPAPERVEEVEVTVDLNTHLVRSSSLVPSFECAEVTTTRLISELILEEYPHHRVKITQVPEDPTMYDIEVDRPEGFTDLDPDMHINKRNKLKRKNEKAQQDQEDAAYLY